MVPSPSHLSRPPRRLTRLRTQAGLVAHPQIHIFALPHYLHPQPRNPEISPMDPCINPLNPEASVASRYKTDTILFTVESSLRSRRLELRTGARGERKPSLADAPSLLTCPVLSCAHYFQAPATHAM